MKRNAIIGSACLVLAAFALGGRATYAHFNPPPTPVSMSQKHHRAVLAAGSAACDKTERENGHNRIFYDDTSIRPAKDDGVGQTTRKRLKCAMSCDRC